MTELFLWILSAGSAYGGAGLLNGFTERGFRLYPEDLEHPGALGETQSRRRIFCLGTALLFSFLCLSETGLSGAGLLWGLLYMMTLSEVFMTDLEQSLIFDECPVLLLLLGLAGNPGSAAGLPERAAAGLALFALFFVMAVLTRGGISGGDIKLVGALGFCLGWTGAERVLLGGIAAGGLAAVLLVLGGWKGRKDPFPYGPYFAAAAMAAWLVSLPGFTDMHR